MDSNKSEIKRYLESYKRIFFQNQLDNPKKQLILRKRKEALNLTDIDVVYAEKELKDKLMEAISFIKNIIDLGNGKELSEYERKEIRVYFEDINLDIDDIEPCISMAQRDFNDGQVIDKEIVQSEEKKEEIEEFIKNEQKEDKELIKPLEQDELKARLEVEINNKGENSFIGLEGEIIEEEKEQQKVNIDEYLHIFDNDEKLLIENDEFFYDYINITSRDFKLESLKLLFFNGAIICLEKLKEKIEDNILGYLNNKSKLIDLFYESYGDLIDYTYGVLVKENICEDNFPKDKLFEKIFGLQCLDTLIKQIHKIKIMNDNGVSKDEIKKSVERSVGVYKSNSDKENFKTKAIEVLNNRIGKIFKDDNLKYDKNQIVENSAMELFIGAVIFINKCAIANFDIYTDECGRSINTLIGEGQKSEIFILGTNAEDILDIEEQLLEHVKKYPFNEELYVSLSKSKKEVFVKYDFLNRAIDLIDNCGEKNSKLLKELKSAEIEYYNDYLSRISEEADIEIRKALCNYAMKKFNLINNVDIVFEGEISNFGYLVSNIDIEGVNEDLRVKVFKNELKRVKTNIDDEESVKEFITINKEKYKVSNWECFKVEYSIFGDSYEGEIFNDLDDDDKKSLLDYCMKSIRELNLSKEERKERLSKLQERKILSKKELRIIEFDIFEEVIPLDEKEEKEFDFAKITTKLYDKYLECLIKLDLYVRDKKCNILVPEVYNKLNRDNENEEIILIYSEKSNFSSKSEHFIISNKRIYSTYENAYISLNEVMDFKVKSYSQVIKGERIFFEGIFINGINKEFKLCSNLVEGKEKVGSMLNELIEGYRKIYNIAIEIQEENPLDTMVSFMEETSSLENKKVVEELKLHLCGNKFYELMSDVLNCGNLNSTEIILEISKVISAELVKKIFFKDISEGYSEKLSNACASYVLEIDKAEDVLFVYDNSRFGSAKEGIIVSNKGVYCKNRNDNPWFMELKYINNIRAKEGNKILLNNRIIEFSHIKTKEQLYEMRDLLEIIIFINNLNNEGGEEEKKSPIMSYIVELLNSIKSENLRKFLYLHTEGKIAEKKFNNAINSYADLEETEKPLILFDSSTFGFNNSGFLVTTKNIYSKEAMGKPIRFDLGAVYKVKFKEGNFYINSVLLKLNGLTEIDKEELAEKMYDLVEFLKENFFKKAVK